MASLDFYKLLRAGVEEVISEAMGERRQARLRRTLEKGLPALARWPVYLGP